MKIDHLKIFTSNLERQLDFYEKILGLPVKKVSDTTIIIHLGYSVLEMEQEPSATPYHIAFHIPAQQEEKALSWLEEKLEILEDDGNRIVDFPAWKAKSVYFYDADKNILEFISRRDLFPPVSEEFSADSILGISEIGLATENVEEKFRFLNTNFGIEKFSGDYERFCASGDDEGLFIIINRNEKDWIPTGDKAFASPFEISLTREQASFNAVFKNDTLQLK